MVVGTDTVSDPWAVMIHHECAFSADAAVMCSLRFPLLAFVAFSVIWSFLEGCVSWRSFDLRRSIIGGRGVMERPSTHHIEEDQEESLTPVIHKTLISKRRN